MKHVIAAVASVLICACTPTAEGPTTSASEPALPGVTLPVADLAGNRMEALTQSGARWCSEDGVWCIEGVSVTASFAAGFPAMTLPGEGDIWPVVIRSGESAIVGLIRTEATPYSGGGASVQHLTLYEVAGGEAREAARMPYAASSNIRACFDEDDQRQRAGACQDLYTFVTRISLDESVTEGAPRVILETAAGSYPGAVTRSADSSERPALTEADLVWARDEQCTFQRVYARNTDGTYSPDQPLPACSDYLEP